MFYIAFQFLDEAWQKFGYLNKFFPKTYTSYTIKGSVPPLLSCATPLNEGHLLNFLIGFDVMCALNCVLDLNMVVSFI